MLPRGLARSLSVRHLAIACCFSEAEPEPCPPALSIPTPSLAFWRLLALSMAERSSLSPPPFPTSELPRVPPRAPPPSPHRATSLAHAHPRRCRGQATSSLLRPYRVSLRLHRHTLPLLRPFPSHHDHRSTVAGAVDPTAVGACGQAMSGHRGVSCGLLSMHAPLELQRVSSLPPSSAS